MSQHVGLTIEIVYLITLCSTRCCPQFAMIEFAFLSAAIQEKKIINDIANIKIKTEKNTPFAIILKKRILGCVLLSKFVKQRQQIKTMPTKIVFTILGRH